MEGDETKIACSYESLCSTVKVGSPILIADGSLTCEVTEVHEVSLIFFIYHHYFLIGSCGLYL